MIQKMNAQGIILTALIEKYMKWFNLTVEESLSFILSNPEYFAVAFTHIYNTAHRIMDLLGLTLE